MKSIRSVHYTRSERRGRRYRVTLNLVTDMNEFELNHQLRHLLSEATPYMLVDDDTGDWELFLFAEDELDAAIKANRLLQQIPGLEETQDAE